MNCCNYFCRFSPVPLGSCFWFFYEVNAHALIPGDWSTPHRSVWLTEHLHAVLSAAKRSNPRSGPIGKGEDIGKTSREEEGVRRGCHSSAACGGPRPHTLPVCRALSPICSSLGHERAVQRGSRAACSWGCARACAHCGGAGPTSRAGCAASGRDQRILRG